MADDFDEAIVSLRRARAELAARIEKIDRALKDLIGSDVLAAPSPAAAIPTTASRATPPLPPAHRPTPARRKRRKGTKSVKQMVADLLDEGPRDWTAPQIRDEYVNRGTPIHREGSRDPVSPIRTALLNLYQDGNAIRTGEAGSGQYRAKKYATDQAPDPTNTDRSADFDRQVGRFNPPPAREAS